MTDPLDDFARGTHSAEGTTRVVYRTGAGPAVIVMSEIPGITPEVAGFARRVGGAGLTAVMPHLFGEDGRPASGGYAMATFARACVAREFTVLAAGRTSPIISWLLDLARAEHARCGGTGVGAVGMCFTGGFALGMMVDDVVVAPVLSQPSLPLPLGRRRKRDLGVSEAEVQRISERVAGGTCVLGLRFTGDVMSPPDRFAHLRELLGDGFIGVEIDSSPSNPHGHKRAAHSVLTNDLDDRPGTPTRAALDQVLEFFRSRLLG
jgi:dienelactone hydrolase